MAFPEIRTVEVWGGGRGREKDIRKMISSFKHADPRGSVRHVVNIWLY